MKTINQHLTSQTIIRKAAPASMQRWKCTPLCAFPDKTKPFGSQFLFHLLKRATETFLARAHACCWKSPIDVASTQLPHWRVDDRGKSFGSREIVCSGEIRIGRTERVNAHSVAGHCDSALTFFRVCGAYSF